MKLSHGMLESFYYTLLRKGVENYRGYTFKFFKKQKEFRLQNGNRKLASWFLETDQIMDYKEAKTPGKNSSPKSSPISQQRQRSIFRI
ncbi:hypothetical protein [Evansella tamaricis]|uniref:Uncharacterized protein n=1 Tax=Evansella tamaricis TaxID=2069301 RepID=A0ABS6JKD1_9BACI|nr:hypothetical protein [Evansella tamaricis]MBU9714103.1 hypothetical protein [Evansella tamaricis]